MEGMYMNKNTGGGGGRRVKERKGERQPCTRFGLTVFFNRDFARIGCR